MIAHHDNPTETRRQATQAAIDATKSAAERNRLGQFATPNALAIDIARYVDSLIDDPKRGVRFADPSIGSGSVFSAALAEQGASGGIFISTGELDPEVQRRLADNAALRHVHVYDGPAFVRALEEAAVGVQRYAVPLLYLDVELLDALG